MFDFFFFFFLKFQATQRFCLLPRGADDMMWDEVHIQSKLIEQSVAVLKIFDKDNHRVPGI